MISFGIIPDDFEFLPFLKDLHEKIKKVIWNLETLVRYNYCSPPPKKKSTLIWKKELKKRSFPDIIFRNYRKGFPFLQNHGKDRLCCGYEGGMLIQD